MFKNICRISANTSGLMLYSKNMPLFTFATKMRAGVTKNKKDSAGRRLGLKKYGGEEVTENQILIRQRGFRWKPGENVHFGKDHTLHASKEGKVYFTQDPWSRKRKVSVHVVEQEVPNRKFYPPPPFMYHPELFPELAKNNYKGGPLRILHDEKVQIKKEATMKLNEAKKSMKEHRLVSKLNLKNNTDNFISEYLKSAKESKNIPHHYFTSKYEIQPIIDEMKDVATKYLLPNFKSEENKILERYRREVNAEQRGEMLPYETIPVEEKTFNINEFYDRDSFGVLNYSNLIELYRTHVNKHSSFDLQEMMIEMKEKGMISMHTNIKISDDYLNIKEGEKIYSDQGVALKIEYEELLEKMNDFTEEEISEMLSQYHLKSKEELIAQIEEEISNIDQELMINHLGLINQEK